MLNIRSAALVLLLLSAIQCGAQVPPPMHTLVLAVSGTTVRNGFNSINFRLDFRASDDKFYYHFSSATLKGAVVDDFECAFDGTRTFFFMPASARMVISSGNNTSNPWVRDINPLYYLYSFSSPRTDPKSTETDPGRIAPLSAISKTFDLRDLLRTAKLLQDKGSVLVVSPPPVVEPLLGADASGPADVQVFLDKTKGYFPVGWRKQTAANEHDLQSAVEFKVLQDDVIKFQGGSVRYPKKSMTLQYNGAKPFSKTDMSIDAIQIDTELSDDTFQIDPARASIIEDDDARRIITVPR